MHPVSEVHTPVPPRSPGEHTFSEKTCSSLSVHAEHLKTGSMPAASLWAGHMQWCLYSHKSNAGNMQGNMNHHGLIASKSLHVS